MIKPPKLVITPLKHPKTVFFTLRNSRNIIVGISGHQKCGNLENCIFDLALGFLTAKKGGRGCLNGERPLSHVTLDFEKIP